MNQSVSLPINHLGISRRLIQNKAVFGTYAFKSPCNPLMTITISLSFTELNIHKENMNVQ